MKNKKLGDFHFIKLINNFDYRDKASIFKFQFTKTYSNETHPFFYFAAATIF